MIDRTGRQGRMLALLAAEGPDIDRLCTACVARFPGMAGASVAVMSSLSTRHLMYATRGIGEILEDLQFTLGEGPYMDAYTDGAPVLVPDLNESQYVLRWPMFAPAGVAAGAQAVFAFPLQVGAIRIGVLDLYRTKPGALTEAEVTEASLFADAVTLLLLVDDHNDRSTNRSSPALDHRSVVHQATGMVAVQLAVSIADALVLLRTYAYAHDRLVDGVARDVVARILRFNEEDN
jgi:hypothetical protein